MTANINITYASIASRFKIALIEAKASDSVRLTVSDLNNTFPSLIARAARSTRANLIRRNADTPCAFEL